MVKSDGSVNIIKTLIKLLLGLSSGQLYFILVLVQLTILAPFFLRVIENSERSKYLLLIIPLYLVGLYVYSVIYKSQVLFYQTPFPAWFSFCYLGLWIKSKGYKPLFKRNNIINSIVLCVIGLIISIIEGYFLLFLGLPAGFASSQIKASSFLYTLAVINLLMGIKPHINHLKINWLKKIGDNSYGIYYVHIFWIMASSRMLALIPFIDKVLPVYQLLQLTVTIILSYLSIYFAKKLLGDRLSGRYLGF